MENFRVTQKALFLTISADPPDQPGELDQAFLNFTQEDLEAIKEAVMQNCHIRIKFGEN